jgi:hypothetical protein
MYTVRKEMGAHTTYSTFRAALELMEMLYLDPEMGCDAEVLEMLDALVWKGTADNRGGVPSRWEFDSDSAYQEALASISKRRGTVTKVDWKAQSELLQRKVQGLQDQIVSQDAKFSFLAEAQDKKITSQNEKIASQDEKITSQDAKFEFLEAHIVKLESLIPVSD